MKPIYRTLTVFACLIALTVASRAADTPRDPQTIVNNLLAKYRGMTCLEARGQVNATIKMNGQDNTVLTSYTIRLGRPKLYRIEWTQSLPGMPAVPGMTHAGAVWNGGAGPFVYIGVGDSYSRCSDDRMAIASATGVSGGAANFVPSLFFPDLGNGLRKDMPGLKAAGEENVQGEVCDIVSADFGPSVRLRIWVGRGSGLLRQFEQSTGAADGATAGANPALPGATMSDADLDIALEKMGQEKTDANRKNMREMQAKMAEMMKNVHSTSVQTIGVQRVNAPFANVDFMWAPPAGVKLSDKPFGTFTPQQIQNMNQSMDAVSGAAKSGTPPQTK